MKSSEIYNAIQTGNRQDAQQALFEILWIVQVLSTAVVEMAGGEKLKTGKDPLSTRSRAVLGEFLELPKET